MVQALVGYDDESPRSHWLGAWALVLVGVKSAPTVSTVSMVVIGPHTYLLTAPYIRHAPCSPTHFWIPEGRGSSGSASGLRNRPAEAS
jgi:hypothetical protein